MQRSARTKLAALAIAASGTFLPSAPARADAFATHCNADALNPAVAKLRLEWARGCGARINVVSPTTPPAPAFAYNTGLLSANGGIPLWEYVETDDFWGRNSYSGDSGVGINQVFTQSQWRTGAYTATTDVNGFQRWTQASTLALTHPTYPTFGNSVDITTALQLFPNPSYSLLDCKLYWNSTGTQLADTSVTGFFVNGYCNATDTLGGRCADGTQEQIFSGGMVGCAGAVPFANRNALCAPGFRTVSATEWTALRNGAAPTHDYWTNDNLKFAGTGTSACSASVTTGTSCGTTPMRVCTAAGTDAEGNQCNWQHCGLDATAPDNFFGGCSGNTNAGALCIVGGCADGTIEQTFAGGMVGCAATETYANRASLCGPGYRLATAAEWVSLRNGIAPTHNYWTNDALKYNGTGSSSCFVSTSGGNDCGTTPMRVCAGTDPEGNVCNWTHCGINATTPDQFFGGCAGNTSAGALCVPSATPPTCVGGSSCTVDLSACSEAQKASAWQGQTTLTGTLQMASYTSHFNWVCQTSIPQAWPVVQEPGWWCGTVVNQCTCSAADNCH